jgi:wyosine [tRNA(Phe)-imidazoG37] synthetase (radical SAM superfamily)
MRMTTQSVLRNIRAGSGKLKDGLHTIWADLKNEARASASHKRSMIFGPVPSRRLGRSLGVNTLPTKSCSYDCVYCQAGRTASCTLSRQFFVDPLEVYRLAEERIRTLQAQAVPIDYISLVPNGEPTLDCSLSKTIRCLREFGYKVAVFTNASLLWNDSVKEDLMCADYVSVKVDSVNEASWRRINRPHPRLRFDAILESMVDFSRSYNGILTTETMFIHTMNDSLEEVRDLGRFLARMKRKSSYFAVPVRPPAESYAVAPPPATLSVLSRAVTHTIAGAEMICCPEATDFDGQDDPEEALLGILAVHPMTAAAIEGFLMKKEGTSDRLRRMVEQHILRAVEFRGTTFYLRGTSSPQPIEALHHA